MQRPTITSVWWPLLALLMGVILLSGLFWAGYVFNKSSYLDGLKAQDWATIASGVFSALAFAGFMVSLFYQRAEIIDLQEQVKETVEALKNHAASLREQAVETRRQTEAALAQVDCQRRMLVGRLYDDIETQIQSTEAAVGGKFDELFDRLRIGRNGAPAIEELLKKDNPSSWLSAVIRREAMQEGQGQEALARFLEQRRIPVIINTIISRCDLVSESVSAMAEEAPHMKPRLTARLADSRVKRILAIMRYTREDLDRRPANAA